MNRPTFISAENFEGRDFQHDLRLVNVFAGVNDCGKTTVLNAVQVALLGYLPKLGKQNIDTIKLAGENRLEFGVTLQFEGGFVMDRRWKRNAKGDIKKTEKLEITDPIPAVMFDLREYLGWTKKERIAEISSRFAGDAGVNDDELIAKLAGIEALPIIHCKPAIEKLVALAKKSITRRNTTKTPVREWLATFISELDNEAKNAATQEKARGQQIFAMRGDGSVPKSREQEIKSLQEELDKVKARLVELQTKKLTNSNLEARKREIEGTLARPIPSDSSLTAELNSLQKRIAAFDRKKLETVRDHFKNEREILKSFETGRFTENSKLDERRKKLEEVKHAKKCPYCNSSRKDWKDECLAEIEQEIKDLEMSIAQADLSIDGFKKSVENLAKKEALLAANEESVKSAEIRIKQVEREIDQIKNSGNARAALQTELTTIKSGMAPVDETELQSLEAQKTSISEKLNLAIEDEKKFSTFSSNRELREKLEHEQIAFKTENSVFKQASALVLLEQENIVSVAFQKVLEHARKFTDGILPGELAYRDGEIGMNSPLGFVPHETMAMSLQTIAYIGIAMALTQNSPAKIVLLDEAGIIHPSLKKTVVERLLQLCRTGTIDAVFMTDPTENGYETFVSDSDFQLVNLSR